MTLFGREIAAGQRLLNAVLYLLCRPLQLHLAQLGKDVSGLLSGGLPALLDVDRPEHLCHARSTFERGATENTFR